MPGGRRSAERIEWLNDLLSTAIEHGGYGFVDEISRTDAADGSDTTVYVIEDRYTEEGDEGYGKRWTVTIDTMAAGLAILRKRTDLSSWYKELLKADRTNGADGDYDVITALGVLETALFGEVTYG